MADNRFKTGLLVTNSPHVSTTLDTRRTMLYVLIALIPAAAASTIFFGFGALIRILLGMVFGVAFEYCSTRS